MLGMLVLKAPSYLTVPTYNHLFASKHDICGSLQAREVWDIKLAHFAEVKNCQFVFVLLQKSGIFLW